MTSSAARSLEPASFRFEARASASAAAPLAPAPAVTCPATASAIGVPPHSSRARPAVAAHDAARLSGTETQSGIPIASPHLIVVSAVRRTTARLKSLLRCSRDRPARLAISASVHRSRATAVRSRSSPSASPSAAQLTTETSMLLSRAISSSSRVFDQRRLPPKSARTIASKSPTDPISKRTNPMRSRSRPPWPLSSVKDPRHARPAGCPQRH